MEINTKKQHGAFSWNELMTTDMTGAKAFYSELFGWDMVEVDTCNMPYTILKSGDAELGGMMAIPDEVEGSQAAWGSYVTVDDVDRQVKHVQDLGGKVIIPPRDIPDVGRFSVINDPQGAMLTLITYINQG